MKVHLHVGAHKTATTYVQSLLAQNLGNLNRSGIGYVPLAEMRRGVARSIMAPKMGKLRLPQILPHFFPHGRSTAPRGIIISDENMIGGCGRFVETGVLYGDAPRRLRNLRKSLSGHDLSVFFSIRSYDTFIASAYCEAQRHADEFIRFDILRERLRMEQTRWPLILSNIITALRPTETFVWRYEDFRMNSAAIIRRLAFDTELQGELPGTTKGERQSFSQTAVDILGLIAGSHGPAVAAQLVNPIANKLPKGEDHPPFYPWSDSERDAFRGQYEEDCAALPVPLMTFVADAPAPPPTPTSPELSSVP